MLLQAIPEGRDGRWRLVSDFIEHWIRPDERIGSGLLPRARCRRWRDSASDCPSPSGSGTSGWAAGETSGRFQDTLLPPEALRVKDDLLVFYVENQAVWSIGVGKPIWPWLIRRSRSTNGDSARGPGRCPRRSPCWPSRCSPRSSSSPGPSRSTSSGSGPRATLRAIVQHYSRTALPSLNLFDQETIHYEGWDALIEVSGGDGSLYPSFRSDEARRRFEQVVASTGFEWGM